MPDVVVLGAGVMGAAMALTAQRAGRSVAVVGTPLDGPAVEALAGGRPHPRLGLPLPGIAALTAAGLDEALGEARLLVFGVSLGGVGWATQRLAAALRRPVPVLMVTKGLRAEGGAIEVLPHTLRRGILAAGGPSVPVLGVGGPCIAAELAAGRDTSLVVAATEEAALAPALAHVAAPNLHARPSDDLVGVELCAALKNVYALGVGAAAGRLEREGSGSVGMHNLTASLFAQAVAEMAVLVEALGGRPGTVHGLAGAGDLYVTCLGGRNGRMGRLLGMGLSYAEARDRHMPGETVEGAGLAVELGPTLDAMLADGRLPAVRLPLLRAILDTVCREAALELAFAGYHQG